MIFGKMDFQEIMNSEYGTYIVNGAIGVGALTVGYIMGRISRRGRHRERMAEIDVEKARVDLDTRKQDNAVELKKMEYENEARSEAVEDSRMLEERKRQLEDEDRIRRNVLEDKARDEEVKERDRQYRLDLVSRVPEGVEGLLHDYANRIGAYFDRVSSSGNGVNDEMVKARSNYRKELVDKFIEDLEVNQGVSLSSEDFNLTIEDGKKITRIVDAAYPSSYERKIDVPEMPSELKGFIDLFSR